MKRITAVVLSACMFGLGLPVHAVTFTEISGTHELALGSSGSFKVVANTTLTLTGEATDGAGTLGATFWIPDENVTVTINASGVEGLTTLDLTGHLRGAGTVLAGTGITKVRYGKAPSDMKNIYHLPVLEAQLDVADPSGTIELVKGVSLFRMPEKGTIAAGAVIAPFVAGIFDGSDRITLETYDLMAVRPEAFAAGCEITVNEGRTLYCRPSGSSVSSPEDGSNWVGGRDLTFGIDVVLNGGTFESHAATERNTIAGDFSGTGTLRHRGTADLAFRGKFTIDGTIACVPAKNGTTAISLYPEAGSDFSDTTVCLSTDLSTFPRAVKFMSAAEPLSLASLEADYRNDLNVLYLGAGVSLAIGTVTGAGYLAFDGAGGGATVSADDVSVPRVSVTPGVKFGFESCAVAPVVALAANGMASA